MKRLCLWVRLGLGFEVWGLGFAGLVIWNRNEIKIMCLEVKDIDE